jgi:hypothetical protein
MQFHRPILALIRSSYEIRQVFACFLMDQFPIFFPELLGGGSFQFR